MIKQYVCYSSSIFYLNINYTNLKNHNNFKKDFLSVLLKTFKYTVIRIIIFYMSSSISNMYLPGLKLKNFQLFLELFSYGCLKCIKFVFSLFKRRLKRGFYEGRSTFIVYEVHTSFERGMKLGKLLNFKKRKYSCGLLTSKISQILC